MVNVVAINGSPRMEKGSTAKLLESYLRGMEDAGASTRLRYASRIKARPCSGDMNCWYKRPGRCHVHDPMQELYPEVSDAEILVLATPVFIPLPGDMQNLLNRLCPLVDPDLRFENGRTRARLRQGVRLSKVLLVSTGAWWELQNFATLVRIVEELASDMGIEYSGAVLRPHAFLLSKDREMADIIYKAVRRAGSQMISEGRMSKELLDLISQPLVPEEELRTIWNEWNRDAKKELSRD